MKGAEIFPSKYIKADDLKGRDVPVKISHVALEKLGDDSRLVLYFEGKEKGMVCNKTNFGRIAYLYGDETDDWTGCPIILTSEFVEFQGKTVKGLRIRPPANGKQSSKVTTGRQPAPVVENEDPAADLDEIPF